MEVISTRYKLRLAPDLDSAESLVRYVERHEAMDNAIVYNDGRGLVLTFDAVAGRDEDVLSRYINAYYQRVE